MKLTFLYYASVDFESRAKVLTDSIEKYHPTAEIIHVPVLSGAIGEYIPNLAKARLAKALQLLEDTTVYRPAVVIVGADCEFFSCIDGLISELFFPYYNRNEKGQDVIIVPHVQSPLADRDYMKQLYKTGHANADFMVFRNTENSKNILKWLISVTQDGEETGAFYEQTWLSALPFLFDKVHILRDPEYNVGYWNVNEVGVDNLVMFQFSGFVKGEPLKMSRHSKEQAKNSSIYEFYKNYDRRILK